MYVVEANDQPAVLSYLPVSYRPLPSLEKTLVPILRPLPFPPIPSPSSFAGHIFSPTPVRVVCLWSAQHEASLPLASLRAPLFFAVLFACTAPTPLPDWHSAELRPDLQHPQRPHCLHGHQLPSRSRDGKICCARRWEARSRMDTKNRKTELKNGCVNYPRWRSGTARDGDRLRYTPNSGPEEKLTRQVLSRHKPNLM